MQSHVPYSRGVQNLNSVNALLQTAQTGPQTPAQPQPLKRRYEQSQFRLRSGSDTRITWMRKSNSRLETETDKDYSI